MQMISEEEVTVIEGGESLDIIFNANLPPQYLCQVNMPDDSLCEVTLVARVITDDEQECGGNFEGLLVPQV